MNEIGRSETMEKLLALSKEELTQLFSELSVSELEDLLDRLEKIRTND